MTMNKVELVNSVAFRILGKDIYWYGIIIAVGLIMGVLIGLYEAKRKGYRSELVLDFILLAVPLCIIFARLYYVIFEWQSYAYDPIRILYIWEGGLAIYGGVIGGAVAAVIFYYWRRVSMGDMLDIAAPGLVIGQAIGRWGNFMNQEAFGYAADPKWWWFPASVYIDAGKTINGVYYQPGFYYATFFYESMWNLIVFAALMLFRKKIKVRGGIFALYVAFYGFGRFWIEQLRTDSLMWGNMRVSEGLSELLFLGGIAYFLYMYFAKREYYPYSGYYSLGLTEEQIDAMKGKNRLLNMQQDLKKAQWFAEIMREGSLTSPRYRAVKAKADVMDEKAKLQSEELGEDNEKAKAARRKADALAKKAEKIYAQIKLEGRLKAAQEESKKAADLVESLKESDPDGPELMAAQEKLELANLLVEKVQDGVEKEKAEREAWLEKEELHIEMLEDRVKREEELFEEKKSTPEGKENKDEEFEQIKEPEKKKEAENKGGKK
jgi:phosphatidylglycerol:prolipoprotein diacylglycerol transferase